MAVLAIPAWGTTRARRLPVALWLLLPLLNANGQQALFNALSIDTVLAERQGQQVNLSPDRRHIGPVQLSYGVYAGTEFNDNINASQHNPKADVLLRGGVDLGLNWPVTDQSVIQLGAGVGYVHYVELTSNGGLEVTPNSALTWQIGFQNGSVTLYDQFSYQQQVTQEASLVNVSTLPRIDNTAGARVSWEPGRWELQAGYAHNDFIAMDPAFQYLDSSSEYLFTRAGWHFGERTQAGLEASSTFTSYRFSSQSDNKSISIGPYVDWQVTEHFHAVLRGGPSLYLFTPQAPGQSSYNLSSYYAELDLDHSLTSFLAHQLSFQRAVTPGLNIGTDYVEQFSANYKISLALTPHIGLAINATYEHGSQLLLVPFPLFPELLLQEKEIFDRAGITTGLSWSLTEHLRTGLQYSFWERHSSLPDRGYVQNIISFTMNYDF